MYEFWKITPSGNPTILLKAEDFPLPLRAKVAERVMSAQHLGAEQVGYVRLWGKPRLDMMGGEFCLNATRSLALILAKYGLLEKKGDVYEGCVEVSGIEGDVAVRVRMEKDTLPFAEACLHFVSLPVPEEFPGSLRLIRLPGIAHIVQEAPLPQEEKLPMFCLKQRAACGVAQEEAVGHLWISYRESSLAEACLTPVVWVRDTSTLCRESACGSGTLACALNMYHTLDIRHCTIWQPSGCSLAVRMEECPEGWNIWVGGSVRMTAHGETDLTGILPHAPAQQ